MQGQMSLFESYNYFNRTGQDSADGLLYGNIGITVNEDGSKEGIDGNLFARELDNLLANGVKKINVRINSYGGSVIDGYSIYSAIQNANESGAKVDTYNEFVAASIAGIIAMAGKTRYAYDYSIFMLHDPSFGSDNMSEKDIEVLGKIKSSLVTVLSNSSGASSELIDEMMTNETWLTAYEACPDNKDNEEPKPKFFDKIVVTGRKQIIQNAFYSQYHKIVNQFTTYTKPKNVMEDKNKNVQPVDNTELDSIKAELEKIKSEKAELENKLTEIENAQKEANKEKALELVEASIKEGKITEEVREEYVEMAIVNYNSTKKILNALPKKNVAAKLPNFEKSASSNVMEKEMDFKELSKKNPKYLENLQANDPEKFKEIYNKTYKI